MYNIGSSTRRRQKISHKGETENYGSNEKDQDERTDEFG